MTKKRFSYHDEKIISKGRIYYLRTKHGRRGDKTTLTIRTQKGGKGTKKAWVAGIIIDNDPQTQINLIKKLDKKMTFAYITLTNINNVKEDK